MKRNVAYGKNTDSRYPDFAGWDDFVICALENKAFESKMVDFLASFPCIIYECAADLTLSMITPNVFDLIGIKRESVKGNRSLWQEKLYREDRQRLMTRLDHLTFTETACEQHRIINESGLPVWVSHSFRKLKQSDGWHIHGCLIPLPIEIAAPSPDIGAISQFVHKIGNHFQLINLLIGSLGRNELLKGEINALQETVDRAVEFTRSFSQFSQIAANHVTLNLAAVVDLVIHDAEPLFDEKKVIFKALIHDSLNGVMICGDSFLLEIALGSILQNALEATKSGDEVTLEGKANTAQGCMATISIMDTGCGMEEQVLENATAPFFSSKPERNGLGLSMASRVVDMHGGRLTITSEAGQGTRVDISLPLKMFAENSKR